MGASCTRPKSNVVYNRSQEDSALLTALNDDLLTLILSFCASAPLNDIMQQSLQVDTSRMLRVSAWITNPLSFVYKQGTSTLTHELPLVCQRFRDVCYGSDLLWIDALAKTMLIEKWDSRKSLLKELGCADLESEAPDPETMDLAETKQKLGVVCRELSSSLPAAQKVPQPDAKMSMARFLYRELWQRATQTLPAFFLRSRIPMIGEPINLHLFELRYRVMIAELVEGRPASELNGRNELSWPYPKFLFVPLIGREPPTTAFLMVVKRCRMNRDGRADISIVSIQAKKILSSRVRPNSHDLHEVTV